MIKGITVFFLDLIIGSLASKLIDVYWGKQPEITPIIIFAVLGGVLYVFIQEERELALTWRFHRIRFLFNLRDHYKRLLEIKLGRKLNVANESLVDSFITISNGKTESDLSRYCFDKLVYGKERQKILIIGEPGSGKSFGLTQTAFSIARHSIRKLGCRSSMPVLLRCDEYKESLLQLLKNKIPLMSRGESGKVLGKGADQLLRDGKISLLLDALDETAPDSRMALLREIELWSTSNAYEKCTLIITARQSVDVELFEKLGFEIFDVKELTNEGVKHFVDVYKQNDQITEDVFTTIQNNNLIGERGLGRNPFWLSLMVQQNVFAGDYVVILDKSISGLLKTEWNKAKLPDNWRKKNPVDVQVSETRLALSYLAFEMVQDEILALDFDEATKKLESFINSKDIKDLSGSDVIEFSRDSYILESSRFNGSKQNPVRFRHPLIRDFLAACYALKEEIVDNNQLLLDDNIKQWWNVLFFALNLLSDLKSSWLNLRRYSKYLEFVAGANKQTAAVLMLACSMSVMERIIKTEVYEITLKRLEQIIGEGFSDEFKHALDMASSVSPENLVEIIGDLNKQKKPANIQMTIDYLVEKAIKSGHKSRLLLHLLESFHLQSEVVNGLTVLGKRSIAPLTEFLDMQNEYSRWDHMPYSRISDNEIQELKEQENVRRKIIALSALARIDHRKAEPYLVKALNEFPANQKSKVFDAIGETGDPKFIPMLLKEMNDPLDKTADIFINSSVYRALSKMGDKGLAALLNLLRSTKQSEVNIWGLDNAIVSFGSDALEGLRNLVRGGSKDTAAKAVIVLGKLKDKSILPDLARLLKRNDFFLNLQVVKLMTDYGEEAVPFLIDSLASEEFESRLVSSLFTVKALVDIGKPAIPYLIEATHRSEKPVIVNSIDAIGQMSDIRAVDRLGELLNSSKDPEVLMETAIALGRIGNSKCRQILRGKQKEQKISWNTDVAVMMGLISFGDFEVRKKALLYLANGGYAEEEELDIYLRRVIIQNFAKLRDIGAIPAARKFQSELRAMNTKESLDYADGIDSFILAIEGKNDKKESDSEELR
ncbi:MAG: NACHT domain-containing protein [Chloroflexi bacterium]|nr:NACHT domain-containing protein [Chloroflexota bacterium]